MNFNEMISEFLNDLKTWQWWVSQGFALIGIIFCVLAM
jgi:hypothetical protein